MCWLRLYSCDLLNIGNVFVAFVNAFVHDRSIDRVHIVCMMYVTDTLLFWTD